MRREFKTVRLHNSNNNQGQIPTMAYDGGAAERYLSRNTYVTSINYKIFDSLTIGSNFYLNGNATAFLNTNAGINMSSDNTFILFGSTSQLRISGQSGSNGQGASGRILQSTGTGLRWAEPNPVRTSATIYSTAATTFASLPLGSAPVEILWEARQGSSIALRKVYATYLGQSAYITSSTLIADGTPAINATFSASLAQGNVLSASNWSFGGPIYGDSYQSTNSFAYGNGRWLTKAKDGYNWMKTSTDEGVTWTTLAFTSSAPGAGQAQLVGASNLYLYTSDLQYLNGQWLMMGYSGDPVWRSTDGIVWNSAAFTTAYWLGAVTYGNGYYVAGSRVDNKTIFRSTDAITWTTTYSDSWGNGAQVVGISYSSASNLSSAAFVANNGSQSEYIKSTDGVTWTSATFPAGVFNDSTLRVKSGHRRVTTDGITWTSHGQHLIWQNAGFYFVYTTDGATWLSQSTDMLPRNWYMGGEQNSVCAVPYDSTTGRGGWWLATSPAYVAMSSDGVYFTAVFSTPGSGPLTGIGHYGGEMAYNPNGGSSASGRVMTFNAYIPNGNAIFIDEPWNLDAKVAITNASATPAYIEMVTTSSPNS